MYKKDYIARKIDCVATYLISCLPMILFGAAIRCLSVPLPAYKCWQ